MVAPPSPEACPDRSGAGAANWGWTDVYQTLTEGALTGYWTGLTLEVAQREGPMLYTVAGLLIVAAATIAGLVIITIQT